MSELFPTPAAPPLPVPVPSGTVAPAAFTTGIDSEANPLDASPSTPDDTPGQAIDAAVQHINALASQTIDQGSLRIGEYVLATFFANDPQLAQSRNPFKNASYRSLCAHQDLLVSPANLNRMVRVAIQESFFRAAALDVQTLSFSHKAELARIPNIPAKIDFVRLLLENGASTRALAKQVSNFLAGLSSPEPPAAAKIFVTSLFSLVKSVDRHVSHGSQLLPQQIHQLQEHDKQRLRNAVQLAETKLSQLHQFFEAVKAILTETTAAPPTDQPAPAEGTKVTLSALRQWFRVRNSPQNDSYFA